MGILSRALSRKLYNCSPAGCGGAHGVPAQTMGSKRDDARSQYWWRSRRWRVLFALVVGAVATLLHVGSRTPGVLQNYLASAGVAALAGAPAFCGSDGRRAFPWMNPADFNASFPAKKRRRSSLRGAAPPFRTLAPLFLVGCGHSGTTPLVDLLGLHPSIYAFAPNAALEYSVKADSFGRATSWAPSRNDDARIAALALRAKGANASAWLVKSPSNVCRLGYVLARLPSARVVGVVRDGRDVLLSLVERYPAADPAGTLGLGRWVNDNEALLLYAADPRVLVVRYEDLFERAPSYPALRRILRHCRVAPDDPSGVVAARARGEAAPRPPPRPAGKTVASDAHTALRAAQLKKPLATSPPRWPTQMTPALRRVFKANRRAVALLARFGYAGDSSW